MLQPRPRCNHRHIPRTRICTPRIVGIGSVPSMDQRAHTHQRSMSRSLIPRPQSWQSSTTPSRPHRSSRKSCRRNRRSSPKQRARHSREGGACHPIQHTISRHARPPASGHACRSDERARPQRRRHVQEVLPRFPSAIRCPDVSPHRRASASCLASHFAIASGRDTTASSGDVTSSRCSTR